jgi:NHS family xanthosine MFS transporter
LFGLKAFKLFGNYKMAVFFVFAMFLGAALQLTNMYGDSFLDDFRTIPQYADSFVVKYSTIIMSISQFSETLFILLIPFFLKRFIDSLGIWIRYSSFFGRLLDSHPF